VTRYAEQTKVSTEQSRNEIERTLRRYGASQFAYGWQGDAAMVGFEMHNRHIRFVLPLPDRNDREFTRTPYRGNARTPQAAEAAWEQACRQRWRALLLCIKAKLEAVHAGITTFDDEFLAHIMLPNGGTVGDWLGPKIEHAYLTRQMPPMLPSLRGGQEDGL
jgi:hypothetical protein